MPDKYLHALVARLDADCQFNGTLGGEGSVFYIAQIGGSRNKTF